MNNKNWNFPPKPVKKAIMVLAEDVGDQQPHQLTEPVPTPRAASQGCTLPAASWLGPASSLWEQPINHGTQQIQAEI